MGFVLSVIYLVTNFLSPAKVFGPLAAYHVELILAALALLASLPALSKSFIFKTSQSLALCGMALAVVMSILVGVHWIGGAVAGFLSFIPNVFAYFLICVHCNSKKKLQILILAMFAVCVFVIASGYSDLLRGVPLTTEVTTGNTASPYLLAQRSDAGDWIFRLRGLGEWNDPNDFGQVLVCLLPLLFFFWRPGKTLYNIPVVLLPVSVILFGAYLTHSRGALVAIMATTVFASRRKIGTIASLIIAGTMFAGASVLNFTGGREISATAGSGRTGLWGIGLGLLREHPLFGVGYNHFSDACECGLTAHNSIVVCAAELGLFGLFFWFAFLFPTVRDALTIATAAKVSDGESPPQPDVFYPTVQRRTAAMDKLEINRLGRLVVLSLAGFLVAGWFLSRAYVLTLFLLGGVAEVLFQIALDRGMVAPRMRLGKTMGYAGSLTIVAPIVMYIVILILNRMGHSG